jgi:type I restriction enzyme M protein
MSADTSRIVNKLWSYCNVLRDDGLSYGDYLEQLTYLLFLKMADEQTRPPWKRPSPMPEGYDWPSLKRVTAPTWSATTAPLEHLGKQHGLLGLVFRKAQNKIQDPAKLKRLVSDLIDKEQWVMVGADIKGDAYEGLLERNAQDTKSGAGQYFTPRPLIDAMVACVAPKPGETIIDPACGTGGFLLAAHHWITTQHQLDPRAARAPPPRRPPRRRDRPRGDPPGAMNLLLHNVGPTPQELAKLRADAHRRGKKPDQADAEIDAACPSAPTTPSASSAATATTSSSPTLRSAASRASSSSPRSGETEREQISYEREDFWASTTNKQLNFVQHVKSLLKIHGRAAVVVPDNVLFEGGAGETIRRKLLAECDVHTLLRLPTGIFYAQGVKANVLFFDRKPASPSPGPASCGSTTCAPTSTSPSRPTP